MSLKDCDMVLVLEGDVPWLPGPNAPPPDARIVVIDIDPIKPAIPTYEFTADLRITADALQGIQALQAAAEGQLGNSDRQRIADRAARWGDAARERREKAVQEAQGGATKTPISSSWV